MLGLPSGCKAIIDLTAAGCGWFIDTTPYESSEYRMSGDSLVAQPDSEAYGRMDLLTVVMHEFGHVLGYEHDDEGLMKETLAPGERQLEFAVKLGSESARVAQGK